MTMMTQKYRLNYLLQEYLVFILPKSYNFFGVYTSEFFHCISTHTPFTFLNIMVISSSSYNLNGEQATMH